MSSPFQIIITYILYKCTYAFAPLFHFASRSFLFSAVILRLFHLFLSVLAAANRRSKCYFPPCQCWNDVGNNKVSEDFLEIKCRALIDPTLGMHRRHFLVKACSRFPTAQAPACTAYECSSRNRSVSLFTAPPALRRRVRLHWIYTARNSSPKGEKHTLGKKKVAAGPS